MKPYTLKVLKGLRKSHNKTQLEVAEFLGISRQAYSRYESNLREPDMETLSNIAAFYNVSPQVFYIDDIDKSLEADMNIVEIAARYQLKSTMSHDSDKSDNGTINPDFPNQNEEQLQSALSSYFGFKSRSKTRSSFKNKVFKYTFFLLIALFAFNIGIMTLHRKDYDYQYNILTYTYISAVTPNQNVNRTMYLDIVKINEFSPSTIKVDDYVVIYYDFGLNEYFVEKVTQVNEVDQTITTTYDNITTTTNDFTDVIGTYEKEANFFGTIYYTSKFNTGYLLLVLGHAILLAIYYLSFFDTEKRL